MKAIKILAIIFILALATSVDSSAKPRHRGRPHYDQSRPVVGAPLDGGLLAVLGAAGVGYLVARKRKKNE